MKQTHARKQTLKRLWHAVAYDKPTDHTGNEWAWIAIKIILPLFLAHLALLSAAAYIAITRPELVDAIHPAVLSLLDTASEALNMLLFAPLSILVAKLFIRVLHEEGVVEPELGPEETLGGEA